MMVAHSELGASGAERWMSCPGSVELIKVLDLPETEDPDYRKNGTAAHAVGALCLNDSSDTWEHVGKKFEGGVECDDEIANSVQVYLDECRKFMGPGFDTAVEQSIAAPDFHAQFFGTLDFRSIEGTLLRVRDYKHGEGIIVEAKENPQIMYYAYGELRKFPHITEVELGIVQPRGFHPDGAVRLWTCSADYLKEWAATVLLPAMERAYLETDFVPGSHCRFCPAKLVCPVVKSIFGAVINTDPKEIVKWSDAEADRNYPYLAIAKMFVKAAEADMLARLMRNTPMENAYLCNKKSTRVWKPDAEQVIINKFGNEAYVSRELKSPAQLEKIPGAAATVNEYAYKPDVGLTVAAKGDKRAKVTLKTVRETFPGIDALMEKEIEG
jgi:hypothetical protein